MVRGCYPAAYPALDRVAPALASRQRQVSFPVHLTTGSHRWSYSFPILIVNEIDSSAELRNLEEIMDGERGKDVDYDDLFFDDYSDDDIPFETEDGSLNYEDYDGDIPF